MMKQELVFYMHAGSGNHGCEAIMNSTCRLLPDIPKRLVSVRAEEDMRYSLPDLCAITQEQKIDAHFFAHVINYARRKLFHDPECFLRYRFKPVLGKDAAPLYVSVGGDVYCYETDLPDAMLANAAFCHAGAKTVLWGCSIEPKLLQNPALVEDMKRYSLITARESLTYEALLAAGVRENVRLYPDPAFSLEPEEVALPPAFCPGHTIGINVSPLVLSYEQENGVTLQNYRNLMDAVLETTDDSIALIPHVVWKNNDDRLILEKLYAGYEENDRVLLIPDMNARQLKYVISKCRLFVGARTHATIAAYSSGVPTLVVGYSVKSRGIARDLFGTEEHYVLPVQDLREKDALRKAFSWLLAHENDTRVILEKKMPDYVAQVQQAGDELRKLWEQESNH